jgi:hypothetical protein
MTLTFVPPVQIFTDKLNLGDVVCHFETIFEDVPTEDAGEKKRKGRKNNVVPLKPVNRLLPICSNCNKIRDDRGYWKQIEGSILDRHDWDFTHGICPQCAKKLYPEYYEKSK